VRDEIFHRLARCLDDERPAALATVVGGAAIEGVGIGNQLLIVPQRVVPERGAPEAEPELLGSLGDRELDRAVIDRARELLATFRSERRVFETAGDAAEVFVELHPPRPKLYVVGAVHVAIPLVRFARELGYRTVVIDPRTAFATADRFPHADHLDTRWPGEALGDLGVDENTFVALLSHDLKLDLPALEATLRSPARYIGALGSRKTHGKRVAALRDRGYTDQEIGRIHNPIGLDLGGRRAEEIAVAVVAEMVAVSHGRDPKG
jgi:xanthine dehydrogenase accessory factor